MLKRAMLILASAMLLFHAACGGSGHRQGMRTVKDFVNANGQILRKRHQGPYLVYIVQSDSLYRPIFRKLTVDRERACVIQADEIDQSRRECRTNDQLVECADLKADPDLWAYINWM